MRFWKPLVVMTLAIALAAVPQPALAESYMDTVTGGEVYATSTLGVFAGSASGPLPGTWYAAVEHTVLSPDAEITDGSFTLTTMINGDSAKVVGAFSGGTVTLEKGAHGCSNQRYAVVGSLKNVGVGGGTGTGTFDATLLHYRFRFFGSCITYGATITGTVTLNF